MVKKNYYVISKEDNSILYCFNSMQSAIKCKNRFILQNIECCIKSVNVKQTSDSIIDRCLKLV